MADPMEQSSFTIQIWHSTIPNGRCLQIPSPREGAKFAMCGSQKQRRRQQISVRPRPDRKELFLSSSHRVTLELEVCLFSRPRSFALASASHRPMMPQPQPAGVRRNLVLLPRRFIRSLCVFVSLARQLLGVPGQAHFPTAESGLWYHDDGLPRRVSVPSHLTVSVHSHLKTRRFSRPRNPYHPIPCRNKTNHLPSRNTNSPDMQGTRQPAPPPNHSNTGTYPSHNPQQHQTRRIRIPA